MSITSAPAAVPSLRAQYCTFWIGDLYFGVAVENVQEVLRAQTMTPVPLSPEAVRGLINLRGQIVTAIDLRLRLALPPLDGEHESMNVIVHSRGEAASLLVDRIGEVIDTVGHELQPTPSNLPLGVRQAVTGVLQLNEAILLVLDPDQAVEVSAAAEPPGGTR